jgi:hypothetical protein
MPAGNVPVNDNWSLKRKASIIETVKSVIFALALTVKSEATTVAVLEVIVVAPEEPLTVICACI